MRFRYLLKAVLMVWVFTGVTPAEAAYQWSGKRKITAIYPASNHFIFYLDGSIISAPGCDTNRFAIPTSSPNYDVKVSSLITAFAGQKDVSVNYDDSTIPSCQIEANRAVISA